MTTQPLDPKAIKEAEKRYKEKTDERNKNIVALYDSGDWTLQRIGDHYGLTREAVRLIVGKMKKK